MPPRLYRMAHPGSRLRPGDVAALCAWTKEARARVEDGMAVPQAESTASLPSIGDDSRRQPAYSALIVSIGSIPAARRAGR